MVFTLALTGCASSSSSSNKKNDVKESKRTEKVTKTPVKNKSNFTVDDLKQHPKMSATAITLYGDTHVQNSRKGQLPSTDKDNFEKGFNLAVESVNSTTAKYYTNSDKLSEFSYYSLLGSNHDQVAYYDAQDKVLLKAPLSNVISYLNKTLTRDEMTSTVGKISIGSKASVPDSTKKQENKPNDASKNSSNLLTLDDLYPAAGDSTDYSVMQEQSELLDKALVYYGINKPNADPGWAALKGSTGSLISFFAGPATGSATMYTTKAQPSENMFPTVRTNAADASLPMKDQENEYMIMYDSEPYQSDSGKPSPTQRVYLPDVVNFVNAAGGKSALNGIQIQEGDAPAGLGSEDSNADEDSNSDSSNDDNDTNDGSSESDDQDSNQNDVDSNSDENDDSDN